MTSSIAGLILCFALACQVSGYSSRYTEKHDWSAPWRKLLIQLQGGRNCESTNKCQIMKYAFECCKNVSIFHTASPENCVAMLYLKKANVFKVVITLAGGELYSGTLARKGEEDIQQNITVQISNKIEANLYVVVECQKEGDGRLKGCVRLYGSYGNDYDADQDQVDMQFGCFDILK